MSDLRGVGESLMENITQESEIRMRLELQLMHYSIRWLSDQHRQHTDISRNLNRRLTANGEYVGHRTHRAGGYNGIHNLDSSLSQ